MRPMGGESGVAAGGRKGACECGGQGNHRLLIDEDARLQIKEYPQPRESFSLLLKLSPDKVRPTQDNLPFT